MEKKYGVITTYDNRVPSFVEAIGADLNTGSHRRNNMASKEFAKNFPTVLAVGIETDRRMRILEDTLLMLKDTLGLP